MTATIILSQKLELARFLSGVDAEGRRIAPAFRSVLFLLLICAAARHWSSARIAAACGVSVRTVGRAFAFWKALGVLDLRRHQRQTAVKSVNVDAALTCAHQGVALVKTYARWRETRCAVLIGHSWPSLTSFFKRGTWKQPQPPSEALKRLLKRQAGRSWP